MNKFKKVFSAMLASAMAVSMLAGCGDTAPASTGTQGTDTAASSEGATFKIGAIGPLTGAAAAYGNAVVNGAQIAVDEINAAGGIGGVKIEYKGEDDELNAEKSVNAYIPVSLNWRCCKPFTSLRLRICCPMALKTLICEV